MFPSLIMHFFWRYLVSQTRGKFISLFLILVCRSRLGSKSSSSIQIMYFLNCLSIPRCTYHAFHISDQQGALDLSSSQLLSLSSIQVFNKVSRSQTNVFSYPFNRYSSCKILAWLGIFWLFIVPKKRHVGIERLSLMTSRCNCAIGGTAFNPDSVKEY